MAKSIATKSHMAPKFSGTPEELANFLNIFVDHKKPSLAHRLVMRSVLDNISSLYFTMKEADLRPFSLPARIFSEPNYLRAALADATKGMKEIENPWGYFEVLTGHPTSSLDLETIKLIHDLQKYINTLGEKTISAMLRYGHEEHTVKQAKQKFKILAEKIAAISERITPAKKLTPHDETERASYFAKQRYDAMPVILCKMDRVRRAMGENDIVVISKNNEIASVRPTDPVSIDTLQRLGGMLYTVSWQADRDSKPNITAETIDRSRLYNTQQTFKWYREDLEKLIEQIREQQQKYSHSTHDLERQQAKKSFEVITRLEGVKKLNHASDMLAELGKIKNEFEASGFRFPALLDGETYTKYSLLDVFYIKVSSAGDCYPPLEMRQNATMHRHVLEHIKNDLLPVSSVPGKNEIDIHNINSLVGLAKSEPAFGNLVRKKIEEYEPLVLAFYANGEIPGAESKESFDKKLKFYETLKGLQLTSLYPSAIKTYVIAETGVIYRDEDKVRDMNVRERRQYVAEHSRDDFLTVLLFKHLVTPEELQKSNPQSMATQIIPLSETREAIISADKLFSLLYQNDHFKEYVKTSFFHDVPEVFDTKLGEFRPINVAEAKLMRGLEPIVNDEVNDYERPIKGRICAMFAGSDSKRENGDCISPLNAHNQEQLIETGLTVGYWVDIYQGVGGASHRSNPSSFTSARATEGQGAANHYFIPEAIATRVEAHHASDLYARAHYKLSAENDQRYAHIVAIYPGHIGNSLNVNGETKEIREEAFMPLYKGCIAHAKMFKDPKYDHFIEHATALEFTKQFNFSARPNARVDRDFKASSLRAIGYNLALFTIGANTTSFKGIEEFLGLKPDGSFELERTQKLLLSSAKIQDMLTRCVYGMAIADYDMAWKFQGVTRFEKNGEGWIRSTSGKEISIKKLAESKSSNKENYTELKDFGAEAQILAGLDRDYHQVAKAVYETYLRLQYPDAPAVEDKIKNFTPENLMDIMPPVMREEVQNMREKLTLARSILSDKKTKHDDAKDAFTAIEEILETGVHESLSKISRTFNNDFVMAALHEGAEKAMQSKGHALVRY